MRKYKEITDQMCGSFLREMREFGYPNISMGTVRAVADQLQAGTYNKSNVIAVMFAHTLDDLGHFEETV